MQIERKIQRIRFTMYSEQSQAQSSKHKNTKNKWEKTCRVERYIWMVFFLFLPSFVYVTLTRWQICSCNTAIRFKESTLRVLAVIISNYGFIFFSLSLPNTFILAIWIFSYLPFDGSSFFSVESGIKACVICWLYLVTSTCSSLFSLFRTS